VPLKSGALSSQHWLNWVHLSGDKARDVENGVRYAGFTPLNRIGCFLPAVIARRSSALDGNHAAALFLALAANPRNLPPSRRAATRKSSDVIQASATVCPGKLNTLSK
jgi:hypothetical protein